MREWSSCDQLQIRAFVFHCSSSSSSSSSYSFPGEEIKYRFSPSPFFSLLSILSSTKTGRTAVPFSLMKDAPIVSRVDRAPAIKQFSSFNTDRDCCWRQWQQKQKQKRDLDLSKHQPSCYNTTAAAAAAAAASGRVLYLHFAHFLEWLYSSLLSLALLISAEWLSHRFFLLVINSSHSADGAFIGIGYSIYTAAALQQAAYLFYNQTTNLDHQRPHFYFFLFFE